MPVLEPIPGMRVVADPAALDAARWRGDDVTVLRLAPDDALGIGAASVEVDDVDAIVEPEVGFSGAVVAIDEIVDHVEWSLPVDRPAIAQGSIAGVPAKLWLAGDGTALVLTATAYADELERRLR